MIELALLLVVFPGVLMALLLFLVSGNAATEACKLASNERPDSHPLPAQCPPAVVRRLFSPEDWNFVNRESSPDLKQIYTAERKRVAAHWVRQTSAEISNTMRGHLVQAGRASNLKVAGELRLFLQFVTLRVMCGLLLVVLRFMQPHLLGDFAAYTGQFSEAFCAALPPLAMGAGGSGAPGGNAGAL